MDNLNVLYTMFRWSVHIEISNSPPLRTVSQNVLEGENIDTMWLYLSLYLSNHLSYNLFTDLHNTNPKQLVPLTNLLMLLPFLQ